jgi:multicomponent Na+:H+ antiporter subunit F
VSDLFPVTITFVYGGLLISFLCAFIRLLMGPTHADRVVALDLIGFITISFIATHAISSGETAFLDIATTLALVAFLGTIAFVKFIGERLSQTVDDKREEPWKH